jgi:hypothetical protein
MAKGRCDKCGGIIVPVVSLDRPVKAEFVCSDCGVKGQFAPIVLTPSSVKS